MSGKILRARLRVWIARLYIGPVIAGLLGSPAHSAGTRSNPDLLTAVKNGQRATVITLLAKGADPNVRDAQGNTALILAAAAGHLEIIQDLLAKGAQVNAQNRDRDTALIALIDAADKRTIRDQRRVAAVAKALLSHGAELVGNPSTPHERFYNLNETGKLAFDFAVYDLAETKLLAAVAAAEKFGPTDPRLATSLGNLATVYTAQDRSAQAEPLLKRSLAIEEKELRRGDPRLAVTINNLALSYHYQGKYAQAEPLFSRALGILERASPGTSDPAALPATLSNLGDTYLAQRKYSEAQASYQRSLSYAERFLGPTHPGVALSLTHLANVYLAQGKYPDAERSLKRALPILDGSNHPNEGLLLQSQARLLVLQKKYIEAETALKRGLVILENAVGPTHSSVALLLDDYVALL